MNSKRENEIVTASKLLKNKIFSGVYKERRLIEIGSLATYKDVIIVDKSEHDFMIVLRKVNELLKNSYPELSTTCISESSQFSLWTNLNGVTFGPHWFQIRNVTVNQKVVNIDIKCLRSIDSQQSSNNQPIIDWSSFSINSEALKNISHNVSDIVTKENIVQSLRFLTVVLLAAIMACYQLLLVLLQLIHELNFLIRSFIPVFIACVESVTKAFGGLLILIAMMWRTPKTSKTSGRNSYGSSTQVVPTRYNAIAHSNQYQGYPYAMSNRDFSANGGRITPGQVQY